MIKKLLSTIVSVTILGIINSSAQCTPDLSCLGTGVAYGVCPDSATGLAIGSVGVAYTQKISFRIPSDGSSFGVSSAVISSMDIVSIDSLAPGLTYPSGTSFAGGTDGCITISGTPTAAWNHKVKVNLLVHGSISGFPATLPESNTQYRSIVTGTTGIETLDLTKFDVDQNIPNPFTDKTEIHFSSVANSNIDFKVYNVLGAVVYTNKLKAEKGSNTIKIEGNSFAPGVYIYSLSNGEKTITKRMIVSGK